MRIAIDARVVQPKLQGVGRYAVNLLLGLSSRESDLEFLVFYNNPLARKLVERSGGAFRGRFQWIRTLAPPGSLIEKAELPWLLKLHKADLFHDVANLGVRTGGLPSVVTVHELAGLRFQAGSSPKKLRRTLRNSRLIISVSNAVAEEIEDHFNISRPKIRVISNAIDPWYGEKVTDNEIRAMRDRFKLQGKYFLCVTADRPSKNIGLVVQTAKLWGRDQKGNQQWVFTIPGTDSGQLRYLDLVEDVWLRPLYAACTALIVPSLYEGFSLPPVEALATGSLPVVSGIAPHREVLGDILPEQLFFDPKSVSSLERALASVSEGGDPLRASVLEKFRLVRDRYSFIEKAEQAQAVYREALRG